MFYMDDDEGIGPTRMTDHTSLQDSNVFCHEILWLALHHCIVNMVLE